MKVKRKSNLYWRGFLHGTATAMTVGNGGYSNPRKLSARAWMRYNEGIRDGWNYGDASFALWKRLVFRGEKPQGKPIKLNVPDNINKEIIKAGVLGRRLILEANKGTIVGKSSSICWIDDCKE